MIPNGINTTLGSQSNEADLLSLQAADLYNLWYELPAGERGSEVYRNKWGSLMHLIISRGLYEQGGVTYVDGSFRVLAIPGRNTHVESGVPVRWQSIGDDGYGYSDHLPLVANFRYSESSHPDWIEIEQPARESDEAEVRAALRREMAVAPETGDLLQQVSNLGRLLRLRAEVLELEPLRVRTGDEEFPVWIPNRGLRREVTANWEPGSTVNLVAVVGMYKGEWQLVIEEAAWVGEK